MMISHDVTVCMEFLQVDVAKLPSMEELIGQFASLAHIKKIGEGTFGEAFKADQVQPSPHVPLFLLLTTMPCYLNPPGLHVGKSAPGFKANERLILTSVLNSH